MTSPISVLLIIGAAVVGPVEAQPRPATNDEVARCLTWLPFREQGAEAVPACRAVVEWSARESLSQLCERAMRGVGVTQLIGPVGEGGFIGHVAGETVRCIPTPAGYRK